MSRRRHSRTLLGLLAAAVTGVSGAVAVAPTSALADPSPAVAPALPPGGSFVPVPPTRVLDTRQTGGRVSTTTFDPSAALVGVDPSIVADVLVNVTVVGAVAPGYVVVGGSGAGTSNGDYVAGTASATLALVPWSAGSAVPVTLLTAADVVVDVQGYVTTAVGATAASFTPLAAPVRAADSRTGTGLHPFAAGETQTLDVRSAATLPTDATAVIANLTVARATAGTFVTGWSGSGNRPTVSSVNAGPGDIVANRALIPLDADGRLALYNLAGRTDLVVDVVGYLSPDVSGSYYRAAPPGRLADTYAAPWHTASVSPTATTYGGGSTVLAPSVTDLARTTAVWLTVAGDHPGGPGYLTVRPGDSTTAPTSDVDLVGNRAVANAGPVRVSHSDGTVAVDASVYTRLVVDLSGWFQAAPGPAPAGLWDTTELGGAAPSRVDTMPSSLPTTAAQALYTSVQDTSSWSYEEGVFERSTSGPGPFWWFTPSFTSYPAQWAGPYQAPSFQGARSVAAADGYGWSAAVYAVSMDGIVEGFGYAVDGELGDVPEEWYLPNEPVQIPMPGGAAATAVFATPGIGWAVLADGRVVSWGKADTGQLGRVPGDTWWLPGTVEFPGGPPVAMAGDDALSFAVDAAGHTDEWGTDANGTGVQVAPTADAGACPTAHSLYGDVEGVWELCSDGTVVQLSDAGRHVDRVLPVSGVVQIGAAAPGQGIRARMSDGRVADVMPTSARYEAGFAGVTEINGTRDVQVTLVGS